MSGSAVMSFRQGMASARIWASENEEEYKTQIELSERIGLHPLASAVPI